MKAAFMQVKLPFFCNIKGEIVDDKCIEKKKIYDQV
jgi:hypothetical protein